MTTLEIIGSVIGLLGTIAGAVIYWMKRSHNKQDELEAEQKKQKQEVVDGLSEGFKNRDGRTISRWINRWRRVRK